MTQMWSTPSCKKRETGSPTDYSEVWSEPTEGWAPRSPSSEKQQYLLVRSTGLSQRSSCSWVWKHTLELCLQGSVQREPAKAPIAHSFLERILLYVVHPLSESMASNLHASGCWLLPSPFRRYACNANQSYLILHKTMWSFQ